VLDVGSGEGIVLDMIHKSSSSGVIYCGIEQSRKAIKIAGSKISNPEVERFLRGDIRDLCLINGESFDLILFNEVLYYLPNPQRDSVELMREYRDHLKEGGLFLVSIWHNSVAPREKNDITWQAVNEVYSGDSCLINAYIRKDDNSGWRIALYSPKR
jgi:SAM-dependent methyltransferase